MQFSKYWTSTNRYWKDFTQIIIQKYDTG